ncbi:MAG TPA: Dyp-type peroxidase [Galbitalea sp.]|jgi:putative iron-dependent peroxidase|nr:Dyp-type peroxidase [Galbitalea sp.]
MASGSWDRVPIEAQSVEAPLSQAAIFLVVNVGTNDADLAIVRDVISDIGGTVRAVGFRELSARLSCIVGVGSALWDRLVPDRRPAQLHEFIAVAGPAHAAPATPGDLLFHIRAERTDLCFEFEKLLLERLGSSVEVVDETPGFRYFDDRDLLGFVDGTENPTGGSLAHYALIGPGEPDFEGGSYVVVQKYLHRLDTWNALPTEQQEKIIGRRKIDNVELDPSARKSHKDLNTITGADGVERKILRDNMPFGSPARGEFGTYFIGYAADVSTIEKMLSNMFLGDPPGAYDRILDHSTAVTGTNFFVPSNDLLESLAAD